MEQKDDDNLVHLLANPHFHKKKAKILNTIDDDILLLLTRKFPHLKISSSDYFKNIEKIESLFMETSNHYIIQEVIEQIILSIINEEVLL